MRGNKKKKFRWQMWLIAVVLCAGAVRQPVQLQEILLQTDAHSAAVQQGVYEVSSFEDLKELSEAAALCEGAFTAQVRLMCDIKADDEAFVPIGDELHRFEGVFDGGGHVIEGLRISGSGSFQGLFGYVGNEGCVRNLIVRNLRVSGMRYTGGITAYSSGMIENCRVEQAQIIGRSFLDYGNATGGIAGLSCGEIIRCVSRDVFVSGERDVGGIAGRQHAQPLSLCISSGRIFGRDQGQSMTGGIAGSVQTGAEVKGCISLCAVRSFGQWTGGVVGSLQSGKLIGCMAVGTVDGSSAGGVSGYAAPQAQLIRCVYIGDLPAGVGQGRRNVQSGVQVQRADAQRLLRNRRYLGTILQAAGF